MKNKFIKYLVITSLVTSLSITAVSASSYKFSDVKEGHWVQASIEWGINNKIIDGYKDGTYRPNAEVTEAEFLKMVVSTYDVELGKSDGAWYNPYYDIAKENNWTLTGITNNSSTYRNKSILRGQVAKLLSSADGKSYLREEDAVQYLFDNNMSNGKKGKTYEGYAPSDALTRAEAIKFVQTFVENRKSDKLVKAEVQADNTIPVLMPTVDTLTKLEKLSEVIGYPVKYKSVTEGSKLTITYYDGDSRVAQIGMDVIVYKGKNLVTMTASVVKDYYTDELITEIIKVLSKNNVDLSGESYGNSQSMKKGKNQVEYNFVNSGESVNSTVDYYL